MKRAEPPSSGLTEKLGRAMRKVCAGSVPGEPPPGVNNWHVIISQTSSLNGRVLPYACLFMNDFRE